MALIREITRSHGGHVVNTLGDGFFLVFAVAADALRAVRDAIRAIEAPPWPQGVRLRIRAGADSDDAVASGWDYVSMGVHRAARVCAAANGGQLLVTSATAALVGPGLAPDIGLVDLGRFLVRDFPGPEQLFQLAGAGLPGELPPPRTARMSRHNLPVERTSFVGRTGEIETLQTDLGRNRLTTITGTGGVGKTRLAVAVAGRMVEAFPDGVWLVELAPHHDEASAYAALARAVGAAPPESVDPLQELSDAINPPRRGLLDGHQRGPKLGR